jgi:hypothetical protein
MRLACSPARSCPQSSHTHQSSPDFQVVPEPGESAPFMHDLIAALLRHYRKTLHVNNSFRLLASE